MYIINEHEQHKFIKSIDESIEYDYFWVLDLIQQDWMLNKLVMLEEFVTPTLTLNIKNCNIEVPAEWNILVYSPETSDVDMVQVSDLTKSDFIVFLYDYKTHKVLQEKTRVVKYSPSSTIRTPAFNKSSMLCHPVSDSCWVMIAPTDTYNKYFKGSVSVGNFLF